MKNLTEHERKVLKLVRKHPGIVDSRMEREKIAKKNGMSEKTLRNRIADLKRYGLIKRDGFGKESEVEPFKVDPDIIYPSMSREVNLLTYAQMLGRRWKTIALIVSVASSIAVIVVLRLPLWYKATAVILPPATESSPFQALGILGEVGLGSLVGGDQTLNRYLALLKSNRLLQKVATKYRLQERYRAENMEETIDVLLKRNMKLEVGDEMQISVSTWDQDQDQVAEMTNYVIFCLDSLNIVLSSSSARNNRQFIESRVEEVLNSLDLLQSQLVELMEKEGILSLPDQVTVGVQIAAELKAQITLKEIELEIAEKSFRPGDPKIRELHHEVESLRNKYHEFFVGDAEERVVPSFTKVPELTSRFERLQRETQYYSKLLEFIGPQYEQAKIEEVKDIPTLQVLDKAVRPEKKARPRRTIIVLTTFAASLMMSLYYVYWKEFIDRRSPSSHTSG